MDLNATTTAYNPATENINKNPIKDLLLRSDSAKYKYKYIGNIKALAILDTNVLPNTTPTINKATKLSIATLIILNLSTFILHDLGAANIRINYSLPTITYFLPITTVFSVLIVNMITTIRE